MSPEKPRPPESHPAEREGPRASWLLVVLVVATGAGAMGWAIYALIRAAGS